MQHDARSMITQAIDEAYEKVFGKPSSSIADSVTYDERGHGDFACSIALREAKTIGKSPLDIAQAIAAELGSVPYIASVEVAPPGFINITLGTAIWREWLNDLNQTSFVCTQAKPKRVSLEFVSANPTGPLVLVNAWQAYYGDILANIYKNQGYDVEREYYFNDTGGQINHLGRSIQQSCGASFDKEITDELYKGDYINDLASKISEDYGGNDRVVSADSYEVGRKAARMLFDVIKAGLLRMGVQYDRFFSETELDTQAIIKLLEEKDTIAHKDGAVWIKKHVTGTDEDQVLVRSEGRGDTYFLKDIAYQYNRLHERKFDWVLTLVGPDHHGQAQRLANTLKFLGYINFSMASTQTVRLIAGGKEVKMSKRAGNFILLDDFLDEVPSDVARYFFGMRDINSHLDIDLDVLKAKTMQNPLFYCMYGYARICSILNKAGEVVHTVSHDLTDLEAAIVKKMSQLQDVLADIEQHQRVHSLFAYLNEFSAQFHEYYEKERVLTIEDDNERMSKLALLTRLQLFYEITFALIGVTPQEHM